MCSFGSDLILLGLAVVRVSMLGYYIIIFIFAIVAKVPFSVVASRLIEVWSFAVKVWKFCWYGIAFCC